MFFFQRILRISWTEYSTIESVLQRAGARRAMMQSKRQKQMQFLGQVIRDGKLEKKIVTGKIEERTGSGEPRPKYMDTLASAVETA